MPTDHIARPETSMQFIWFKDYIKLYDLLISNSSNSVQFRLLNHLRKLIEFLELIGIKRRFEYGLVSARWKIKCILSTSIPAVFSLEPYQSSPFQLITMSIYEMAREKTIDVAWNCVAFESKLVHCLAAAAAVTINSLAHGFGAKWMEIIAGTTIAVAKSLVSAS